MKTERPLVVSGRPVCMLASWVTKRLVKPNALVVEFVTFLAHLSSPNLGLDIAEIGVKLSSDSGVQCCHIIWEYAEHTFTQIGFNVLILAAGVFKYKHNTLLDFGVIFARCK